MTYICTEWKVQDNIVFKCENLKEERLIEKAKIISRR